MKPYKLPNQYLDCKTFQKHSREIQIAPPRKINLFGMPSVRENLSFIYGIWEQGHPLYCVRESLLNDMLQTDVGERLELFSDINLAVPCYALFLPRNTLRSPSTKGGYVDYLIVNHEELNLSEYKNLIIWGGVDSEDNLIFAYKRIRQDGTIQHSSFSSDDVQQQQRALQLRNIVLQSILLLQYYPHIAEEMTSLTEGEKPKGFEKKVEPVEYQLPRWLGQESRHHPNKNGIGSSKSTHFRRGHWRDQPCGQGRSQIKITWIRPAWVSGSLEDIANDK